MLILFGSSSKCIKTSMNILFFSAVLEAAAKPLHPALKVKHVMSTRTTRTQDTTAHARWRLLGSRALKANTHAQIILASRSRHSLAFTSWMTSRARGTLYFVTSAPRTTLPGLWCFRIRWRTIHVLVFYLLQEISQSTRLM